MTVTKARRGEPSRTAETKRMKGSILVVGGYGEVGKVAARSLARSFPGDVVVAGRRIESARAFARATDGAVRALQLDINNLPAPEAYLAGVGLIPGLSGVLAGHLKQFVDRMDEVGSHVMLGSGDEHGIDAVRWMQDYMDRTYTVRTRNGLQPVRSLSSPKKVIFPGERRKRTTYRFDFADQHVIPESVGATGASTYLCFNSRVMTRSIRLLRVFGLDERQYMDVLD